MKHTIGGCFHPRLARFFLKYMALIWVKSPTVPHSMCVYKINLSAPILDRHIEYRITDFTTVLYKLI